MPLPQLLWDLNQTNTETIDPSLLLDGYPLEAEPTSTVFNTLWNNISARLALIENQGFGTGDIKPTLNGTAQAGWINFINGTIGSAASGATIRANADTVNLYTMIWDGTIQANCPVTGGRGANAAADFAANKPIALPTTNGSTLVNVAGGTYALGQFFGEATHTLIEAETPVITPTYNGSSTITPTVSSPDAFINGGGNVFGSGGGFMHTAPITINPFDLPPINSFGSGAAHNNIQPSTAVYMQIKL